MEAPVLSLAGFDIEVLLPQGPWWPALAQRLGHFASTVGASSAALHVVLSDTAEGIPGGDPRVFQDESGLHLQHDQFHGHVTPDGEATLTITAPANSDPDPMFAMALDGLLRLQLCQLLQGVGGLMMHAAGIRSQDGVGHVFFGPSGSGKTTMCRLSHPQRTILCDELIAIRLDQGTPRLYSTPFAGAWGHSLPGDCPLSGLYRLRHAPHTTLRPLAPAVAAREILESMVYYDQSPAGLAQSLDIAARVVQLVPAMELAFKPEEAVWQILTAQAQTVAG